MLMCLVAMEDPGLTVFPTHRLVRGLDADRQEALAAAMRRDFEIEPVAREDIAPPSSDGPLELGYIDSHAKRPLRLRLRDQAIADAALADHARSPTGGSTPACSRRCVLKGTLGYSDDDISHLHDFGYARDADQALALVESGEYDAAFLMRPTPVDQVREIAASGESMPPKSTYFFPKLLTGLLFNPLRLSRPWPSRAREYHQTQEAGTLRKARA